MIKKDIKRKRTQIPIEIKKKISMMKDSHALMSLTDIHNKIFLENNMDVGISTISEILKKSEKWKQVENTLLVKSKVQSGKHSDLESCLIIWMSKLNAKSIPLNENMIKEKAREFGSLLEISNFSYSNGWLQKFKMRFGIKSRAFHGEANNITQDLVHDAKNQLFDMLNDYDPENIFNMDETALFYELGPSQTLSCSNVIGKKISKKRVTLALCANSTGSTKITPFLINNVGSPRIFKQNNFNPSVLLDYESNKKAWMTVPLFNIFLEKLNSRMVSENRRIILLLDNATSHVPLKEYENIQIHHIPPNMTAHIQPMDAGIIHSFKCHYKSKLVKMMINNADLDMDYKLNMIDVIKFVHQSWNIVSKETIANCFRKVGILTGTSSCSVKEDVHEKELQSIFINNNVNISASDYIDLDKYENTGNNFTDEDIIDMVRKPDDMGDDQSITTSSELRKSNSHEIMTAMDCIENHLSEMDVNDTTEDIMIKKDLLSSLHKYRNVIEMRQRNNLVQTKIVKYLINN